MAQCVTIANRLGRRVGEELNIPVYLYESAATRPDRENLENIRRGEYEGLRDAIRTDPNRMPDFGPAELGKAGATVIGARAALIAFNAYLTTNDVEIANKIAKAIRFSNGGLRFVKALGLLVEGRAQVSMNLTNYTKTPIYRVVEMVRREAQRYGVNIAYTELIGLAPEDAFVDSARWYLQLDAFEPNQLLERRLQSTPERGPMVTEPPIPDGATGFVSAVPTNSTGGKAVASFLDEVAGGSATPGGGSVSAFAGALAAALAAMVARLTAGKKKYASVEADMGTAIGTADSLRKKLLSAVDTDSAAFEAVMAANKLDKASPDRDSAIEAAVRAATESPLRVMQLALESMWTIRTVAELGNTNAATDAAVAAHMALAAVEGAALNVRVNLPSLTDSDFAQKARAHVSQIVQDARALNGEIVALAESRAGLA
jgi:glutamate formiminotransferase / formiminotetrahydrofolate cyclodeaminase